MAPRKIAEFMIINRRTGKALAAAGTENGQNVVQAAPTGDASQLWTQSGTRNPVKLINKASGKALDVVHGGVENGTWAHIWDDVEEAASQKWELVKLTATYKKLLNVQSGKVLDIVNMSEEDGALAQLWDDVDGVGQQWKFVPVEAEGKAPSKSVTKRAPRTSNKAAEAPVKAEAAPVKEEPAPAPVKEEAPVKAEPAPAPAKKEEEPKTTVKRTRSRKIAEATKKTSTPRKPRTKK